MPPYSLVAPLGSVRGSADALPPRRRGPAWAPGLDRGRRHLRRRGRRGAVGPAASASGSGSWASPTRCGAAASRELEPSEFWARLVRGVPGGPAAPDERSSSTTRRSSDNESRDYLLYLIERARLRPLLLVLVLDAADPSYGAWEEKLVGRADVDWVHRAPGDGGRPRVGEVQARVRGSAAAGSQRIVALTALLGGATQEVALSRVSRLPFRQLADALLPAVEGRLVKVDGSHVSLLHAAWATVLPGGPRRRGRSGNCTGRSREGLEALHPEPTLQRRIELANHYFALGGGRDGAPLPPRGRGALRAPLGVRHGGRAARPSAGVRSVAPARRPAGGRGGAAPSAGPRLLFTGPRPRTRSWTSMKGSPSALERRRTTGTAGGLAGAARSRSSSPSVRGPSLATEIARALRPVRDVQATWPLGAPARRGPDRVRRRARPNAGGPARLAAGRATPPGSSSAGPVQALALLAIAAARLDADRRSSGR